MVFGFGGSGYSSFLRELGAVGLGCVVFVAAVAVVAQMPWRAGLGYVLLGVCGCSPEIDTLALVVGVLAGLEGYGAQQAPKTQ